jgi:hypothetical protein
MKKFNFLFPLIVIMVFSSCVTPPLEEMKKAQDAVIRAENDADAVSYALNTLISAREALTKMQSAADAKRYEAAKNLAAEASSLAERALVEGKAGAAQSRDEAAQNLAGGTTSLAERAERLAGTAQARDEAADLISSLKEALAETSNALNNAKQVKNIQVDFDSLSQDMDLANKNYDEAKQSFEDNSYKDAITKAMATRSIISGINTRLNEAARGTSRKQ